MTERIQAWSYSRWKDYCKCPLLAKFKMIDRLPEPGNIHMDRGQKIHKMAEVYLLKGGKVPQDLMRMKQELQLLKKLKAIPEDQWAFTKDFTATAEWYGKDTWARIKIDVVANLELSYLPKIRELKLHKPKAKDDGVWVVDWKTGQFRPEASVDQLELYVLSTFLLRPKTSFALASLAFTDVGRMVHAYYEDAAATVKSLKAKWIKRVAPMMTDTKFKPTPGPQCVYCHFRKSIGGPCKHG